MKTLNMGAGFAELRDCRTARHFVRNVITCASLMVLTCGISHAATQLTVANVIAAQDHIGIILESDALVPFTLFSLRNPERAILELEDSEPGAALAGLPSKIGMDHPYIKSIRVTQSDSGRTRLALDFKIEVEPRATMLKPEGGHGYRIVFEIYLPESGGTAPSDLAQAALSDAAHDRLPIPPAAGRTEPLPEADRPSVALAVTEATDDEVWLAVRINHQETAETVLLLRRRDGRLLVSREDLKRWRIRLPGSAPVIHHSEAYYPLDALRGLSYRVDESSQTLLIEAPPGLFGLTEIKGIPASFVVPTVASPGGFVNYDLYADHTQGRTRTSGLLEVGAFGQWGMVNSSFVGRNLDGRVPVVRLDSTWTRDRPAEVTSLRLGDAISSAGNWGRPVRFGGIQWARNFATQPAFSTIPLPGLAGEAALPSMIDLYVNDALRMRSQVPAGPFSIQELPVVTGQGEARLVVKDILGREQIITQPFYVSPRLLQQGLHDYSYELGAVRENFGIHSNDYGRFLVVGTHRIGVTDRFTGEAHGELLRAQQTVGFSGAYLMPLVGVFNTSVAASRSDRGNGGMLALGFDHQSRTLTFGANTTLTNEHFTQLGLQPGELVPKNTGHAFISLATSGYGSLGLAYTHQNLSAQKELKLITLSYGITLGRLGFLNASVLRILGEESKTIIGMTLTRPLDERTSASASATRQSSGTQTLVQVQRNLPVGEGLGYRLQAGVGNSSLREAEVSAQNATGTYTIDAAQLDGETSFRGNISGGIGIMGGNSFLSRRINDSFAVVKVSDYPDVRVYADNQLVARTGADGTALLSRLRPYQKNSIRIEQADLPLDAQIDTLQLDAVPYLRSGLALQFPVKRSRSGLVTVMLDDGEPLPAGAVAHLGNEKEEFPVGQKGQVYLTGLASNNVVQVTWHGATCEFMVPFSNTAEPLPDLGTYTCVGVKR